MDFWNAGRIIELFAECGRQALEIKKHPNAALKYDRTLVTDADRTIERILAAELGDETNGVYILGEETHRQKSSDYLARALTGKTWIIDPVDGTANFAHQRMLWGISIAFAEGGVIRDGGVYMPELGEMMITSGGRAFYSHVPGVPDADSLRSNMREMVPPEIHFDDAAVINLSQAMVKRGLFRGPNPVIAIGTCAYSCVELALGKDAAYVTGCKIWDIAGSLPALRILGFHGRTPAGDDLLSGEICDRLYDLDFDTPRLFSIRGQTFLALNDEIINAVTAHCEFPAKAPS